MKKNLQILGAGASLKDKTNVFEGLYEYNLVFYECGIKDLVNQDNSSRAWEEKYEILDLLYTTMNVIFDGYNVYEISNKIEHQYVELTWIGNYVNANPTLLKLFFSPPILSFSSSLHTLHIRLIEMAVYLLCDIV